MQVIKDSIDSVKFCMPGSSIIMSVGRGRTQVIPLRCYDQDTTLSVRWARFDGTQQHSTRIFQCSAVAADLTETYVNLGFYIERGLGLFSFGCKPFR